MTKHPSSHINPPRSYGQRVTDALKRRASVKTIRVKRFMDEAHPNEDDYKVPSTLRYSLQGYEYAPMIRLMELLATIRNKTRFLKLLDQYYDPGCGFKNGYGNYDDGDRNTEKPIYGIFYHLEILYSRIFVSNTCKTQFYGMHLHNRLIANCDQAEIIDILTHYFTNLDDTLVQELVRRDLLSSFVEKLVEIHYDGDETAKMIDFLNDLHKNYRSHHKWVISFIMQVAFSPVPISRHHFTPGMQMGFYQSIFTDFGTQITVPTDEVIASLVRRVVMGVHIGLDDFSKSIVEQYLPTTLTSLQSLQTVCGVGVEYLQNWMTILGERLAISTVRRNLLEV